MAKLPLIRSARAVTLGLALIGAVFVGPVLVRPGSSVAPTALAVAPAGIAAAEEPGLPPSPEPVPNIDGPVNAGPANQTPPVHHRRHHGDPVMGR